MNWVLGKPLFVPGGSSIGSAAVAEELVDFTLGKCSCHFSSLRITAQAHR